ncbi:hypothetical protein VTK73DRAFT_5680 [Phialemonium thermophilum]|uniref:Uncharacterized protein n=1 Tax=Phialemonium thermophilum TaxID=223376 RepID=A0ABR3V1C1_9PEZI
MHSCPVLSFSLAQAQPLISRRPPSLANTESARDPSLSALWRQLWQLGVRAVSLPETSRAACALLHSLLASDLVPRHHLVDEIHIMVTNSDISGPAVLVDSSLVLMLHLLAIRNLVLPNASDATSSHIIRWVFVKWNPADLMYASLHSHLVPPFDLVNLLRACCGVPLLRSTRPARAPAGAIGQFWKGQKEHRAMLRYLLLLDRSGPDDDDADDGDDDNDDDDLPAASSARKSLQVEDLAQASSAGPEGSHTAKRLVLELLSPKIEELVQLSESWTRRGGGSGGGGSSSSSGDAGAVLPISKPRLQSAASACLVGAQLLPELTGLPSSLSRDVEPLRPIGTTTTTTGTSCSPPCAPTCRT